MEEIFKASAMQLHSFQKTPLTGAKLLGRRWREQHWWVVSGTQTSADTAQLAPFDQFMASDHWKEWSWTFFLEIRPVVQIA